MHAFAADPTTFSVSKDNPSIGEDNQNVFLLGVSTIYQAQGVDRNTFVVMGSDGYAKDRNRTYFFHGSDPCPKAGCIAIISGADPATFSLVSGSEYAKDNKNVYLPDQVGNISVVAGADPSTFTFLGYNSYNTDGTGDYEYGFYAKDKSHVFYQAQLIAGADSSFAFIRDAQGNLTGYARDASHVYNAWAGTVIDGVDLPTFAVLGHGQYAKDKNHVYAYNPEGADNVFTTGEILQGADPLTFQLVTGNPNFDAMDAHHHYLNATVVQ